MIEGDIVEMSLSFFCVVAMPDMFSFVYICWFVRC